VKEAMARDEIGTESQAKIQSEKRTRRWIVTGKKRPRGNWKEEIKRTVGRVKTRGIVKSRRAPSFNVGTSTRDKGMRASRRGKTGDGT